jgi:CheY-like chemotaxis protein
MTGSELAAAIHRLRPEIPIILMTGFAMPSNGEKYRTADFCALLRKPLSSQDIARALARHLPARPPSA